MGKLVKFFIITFCIFCVGFLSPAIYAAQGGNSPGQGKGKANVGQSKSVGQQNKKKIKSVGKQGQKYVARFANKDRVIIADHFRAHPFVTTPLPPGIAKNLARGKPLPPGIAKVFLPESILSSLPIRPGYDYLVAGKDVLLVNSTTGIVSDILANVLK
ncbi:MAG: hypothetical protein A3F11_11710 [Gammaproteobacteria bacterium RIFCSPHIGHO2_12_FULL_37_14]|nr:MAG: hypothetical protein A3F11_11710 [Gammaproteobacteria bacterium RIFCSPHIGHO2_12_FULL_37_14]